MNKVETSKTEDMTITEYIDMDEDDENIEGFTIGKGKKIYWYITPMSKRGLYRCLPIEEHGKLGWPRFVPANQKIKVYYRRIKC